jgi:hypothetical protein
MEFPLPKELTKDSPTIKLTYLGIEKDNFVIDFIDRDGKMQLVKSPITGYKDEDKETLCKLLESKLAFVFPDSAVKYVVAKIGDAVNELYTSDKHAMKLIEKIRKNAAAEAEDRDAEDEAKLKKTYVQKYRDKSRDVLYEAVLIAGKPYFVFQELPNLLIDGVHGEEQIFVIRLVDKILFPDISKPTTELLPPEKEMYLSKPFEFASEKEINKYLKLAQSEDFDSLYRMQKNIVSKYIDASSDTHLTILAADCIFTFFQDKLGQTHYLMFVGDNDTGKTANLRVLQQIGYRAMLDVDITAANIYGFLGSFEEGQGIILEDEADDIDRKPEKMKIYKAGYNAGEKVTRTDITGYGRRTQSWNTYCFKAFTAEKAPDGNAAKGFLDRTFIFHCIRGEPPYDITEILNPAGDNDFTELLEELNNSRELLFAFRLLHYQDLLQNIDLSVKTREKQLCKPLLRLFQKAKCKEDIGKALADMIGQKRGLKRDTLEAKILDVVSRLIKQNQKEQEQRNVIDNTQLLISKWQPNQIPTSHLFEQVAQELGGTYRREGEDKSFETEEHGNVSHTVISRICVDKFGAEAKRTNSIRFLEFNLEKLDKAKSAYIFHDKVEIVAKSQNDNTEKCNDIEGGENNTVGQEIHPGPNNEMKANDLVINEPKNKIKNIEKCYDSSDEYSLLEGVSGRPNEAGELEIEHNTGVSEHKSAQPSGNDKISLYTFKEKNTSQPSPQDTEATFQLVDDDKILTHM